MTATVIVGEALLAFPHHAIGWTGTTAYGTATQIGESLLRERSAGFGR